MPCIETGYLMPEKFVEKIALHFTGGKPAPMDFLRIPAGMDYLPHHQVWGKTVLVEKKLREAFSGKVELGYAKKRNMDGENVMFLRFCNIEDIDDDSDECKQLKDGSHPQMKESDDSRKLRDWVLDHFWGLKNESQDSFGWYYEYDLEDGSGMKMGGAGATRD